VNAQNITKNIFKIIAKNKNAQSAVTAVITLKIPDAWPNCPSAVA
jgi:hypothetical protein